MPPIIPFSIWRYVGPHPGTRETHTVIFAKESEIITISQNHSWLGPKKDFYAQFKFISNPSI